MKELKYKLEKLAEIYSELGKIKKRGIDKTRDVLSELSVQIPEAKITIEELTDDSIAFHICGTDVYVRFLIAVSHDIGCVQWFYVGFNPIAQKKEGKLVIEYFFDHHGNLSKSHSDIRSAMYNVQADYRAFTYKTILEFCHQADNIISPDFQNEKVPVA